MQRRLSISIAVSTEELPLCDPREQQRHHATVLPQELDAEAEGVAAAVRRSHEIFAHSRLLRHQVLCEAAADVDEWRRRSATGAARGEFDRRAPRRRGTEGDESHASRGVRDPEMPLDLSLRMRNLPQDHERVCQYRARRGLVRVKASG